MAQPQRKSAPEGRKMVTPPQPQLGGFLELLRNADRGRLLPEVEDAVREIVTAIEEHGGKGSLTLKFGIKRTTDAYFVNTSLDFNAPKPSRAETLMFADDEGRLMRTDPRQYDFEESVTVHQGGRTASKEPEDHDPETGEITE